jgi:hypothetical protein
VDAALIFYCLGTLPVFFDGCLLLLRVAGSPGLFPWWIGAGLASQGLAVAMVASVLKPVPSFPDRQGRRVGEASFLRHGDQGKGLRILLAADPDTPTGRLAHPLRTLGHQVQVYSDPPGDLTDWDVLLVESPQAANWVHPGLDDKLRVVVVGPTDSYLPPGALVFPGAEDLEGLLASSS